MAVYGYVGLRRACMAVYGYVWLCTVAVYRCVWQCMAVYGHVWLYV